MLNKDLVLKQINKASGTYVQLSIWWKCVIFVPMEKEEQNNLYSFEMDNISSLFRGIAIIVFLFFVTM